MKKAGRKQSALRMAAQSLRLCAEKERSLGLGKGVWQGGKQTVSARRDPEYVSEMKSLNVLNTVLKADL